jgi:two-component system, sensor histidine kinase LadS
MQLSFRSLRIKNLFVSISTTLFFCALCVLSAIGNAHARENIVLPADETQLSVDISDRFSLSVDPQGTKTFEQIQKAEFVQMTSKLLQGYATGTYWLRFTVASEGDSNTDWWLDVEPPWLDTVELFIPDGKGGFVTKKTGDRERFSSRDISHGSFVFRLAPIKGPPQTYYLRIQGEGSIWVRALLWRPAGFAEKSAQLANGQGVTFGVLLLLMLVTALQGASFKDRLYILFVAYVATTFLFMGSGTGLFARYLPDEWPLIAESIGPVSVCLNVTTYAVFCRYFIYERAQDRLLRVLFTLLASLGVVAAVLMMFPSMRFLMPLVLGLKVLGTFVPVISASARLIRGHLNERLVWLGMAANIPVQAVLMVRLAGRGNQNAEWLSLHWFTAALLIHLLLLSFALVERARRVNAERRNYQQQIVIEQQLHEAAEKTAEDQRSFLSMVAHELRGPLSTARSANFNLRQLVSGHSSELVSPRLDRIDNSLGQMASLIEVCLTHERQGSTQALSLQESVEFDSVIEIVKSSLSSDAISRLQWPNLSNLSDFQIKGNRSLLAIAIRNLIENACRYDTSGAVVEVQIGKDAQKNAWRIAVLDRGPGINTELAEKAFSQFSRGEQVQSDGLGLGLGLYIVQRIARMHNGSVTHFPRDGGGSVFEFHF